MSGMESGGGICRADALLSLRPTPAVVEMGALGDVMHTTLNAAHHANRHGSADDRLAVALPGLHIHRGRARPGQEVVLYGSEEALNRFLALDGVQTLLRRGMIAAPEILPCWYAAGEPGTAFLRDRSTARLSPGALRRAQARALRRGGIPRPQAEGDAPDPSVLALHYGAAVVHVRAMVATVTAQPLLVSTYGFSSGQAPAVLPIALSLRVCNAA